MNEICGVILAAGAGKRIGASEKGIPKVMFEVKGKPMIRYGVDHLKAAGIKDIILVVGYEKQKIIDYFGDEVKYAIQEEILGTGHATKMTRDLVYGKYQTVCISYGDHVMYQPETIKSLIKTYQTEKSPKGGSPSGRPTIALLTNFFNDPVKYAFGRIKRNENNEIVEIIEQKDCTPEELNIQESNPGFYLFDANWLYENLSKLKNDNHQHEYYLTDMVKIAIDQGKKISSYTMKDWREAIGINNPKHLEEVEKYLDSSN